MAENVLASAAKLRQAFAHGVPSNAGPGQAREEEAVNRNSDEVRERESLASYKTGTASVPKTGPAILHKGEAVIPAKSNPMRKGLFDKVEKETETPHLAIRRAVNGYILHVEGDAHLESGDHIITDLFDELKRLFQQDPSAFASPAAWKQCFDEMDKNDKDDAVESAKVNPSDSADKVRSESPTDIDKKAGKKVNQPMPATAVKASA